MLYQTEPYGREISIDYNGVNHFTAQPGNTDLSSTQHSQNLQLAASNEPSPASSAHQEKRKTIDNEEDKHGLTKSKPVTQGESHHHHVIVAAGLNQSKEQNKRYDKGRAGGIEGSVYQLKLLMLFLYRAMKNGLPFRLAAEMKAARKFDDLVLEYTKDNGKKEYRLLQAKHKLDESKKITLHSLLTASDGDYSLTKYFFSYQEIIKEQSFKGKINDVIVCTNIDLDINDNNIKDVIKKIESKDGFFDFKDSSRSVVRYQFNDNIIHELKPILMDYKLTKLSKRLVECVLNKNSIAHHQPTDVFKDYHIILAKDIIDTSRKKFRIDFIENKGLSESTQKFRKIFEEEIKNKLREEFKEGFDLSNLNEYLDDKKIKLNLSKNFGVEKNNNEESNNKNLGWPKDTVPDADIRNFLNHLVFAVNQPNEIELGKIIESEIGEHLVEFKSLTSELVAGHIQRRMLNWFKEKEGEFLSGEDGRKLIDSAVQKINALVLIGTSIEHREKLKAFGITFNQNNLLTALNEFFSAQQKIFLITSITTRLSAIKVYQKLEGIKEYKNEDSYLFIPLSSLLLLETQQRVMNAFNSPNSHNLLVIECKSAVKQESLSTLCGKLSKLINDNPQKKIILIAQNNHLIIQLFKIHHPYEYKDENHFSDLTANSQQTLLERTVNFQGEFIPLNQLMGEPQRQLLDTVSPESLMEQKPLVIGEELPISIGYDENYYIDRTFNHQIVIKQEILTADQQKFSDLLAISDTKEAFNQLCQQHPQRNVHWLKRDSDQLIWQQSHGALSALRQYVDTSDTQSSLETELIKENRQKIVIISDTPGMGKSTVLTHLSKQIKTATPALWVVRFDLNDYTEQLKKQLKPNFTRDTAIEFLSKELLQLKTTLEQALFKHSFQHTGKITLLFDGFDEISPDYKDTVLDLLQSLRATSVDKLWATTRPHMRKALEDKLQQISYTLEPFSEANQISFLSKFWQQQLALTHSSPEKLEKLCVYADRLIKQLAKSISDKEKAFTGIPLQGRLLAETYQDRVKEFYDSDKSTPELPEKLGLMDLFDEFIEAKYAIYKKEKGKAPDGNIAADEQANILINELRKAHQQLAVKLLFAEKPVNFLHQEPQHHENINKILTRIGIVQVTDDKIHFIHRTFAEYYAADFLAQRLVEQNRHEKEESEFLLREILINSEYQIFRAFLNGQLAKKLPTASTLTEYGTRINELWSNNFQGRTFLHIACEEVNAAIIDFLFNSLKFQEETLKSLVLANDFFEETVLHKAVYRGNLELCEKLLCYVKGNVESTSPGTLKSLVLATRSGGETILHLATSSGKRELCKWLLDYVKVNLEFTAPGTLKSLVLATASDGETVLHRAVYRGKREFPEWLLDYVKVNLEFTAPGTLKSLVLATASNGATVLHNAAYSGNLEFPEWLLDYVKVNFESTAPGTLKSLVLATASNGATVLHNAAYSGNLEFSEWLLDYVKVNFESTAPGTLKSLVLATASDGATVLHRAVYRGKREFSEWLLNYVKVNFESTAPGTLKSWYRDF